MELINIKEYPVKNMLSALLKDKTTKKNIIFATDAYSDFDVDAKTQITEQLLLGFGALAIQPRVLKSMEEQSERTKKKAEVFNREVEHKWVINTDKIEFEKQNDWKKYVDSKRLEITCGEAPYIVSRYDTTTAEIIPVKERIGILDRKLRVVNENTDNENEWLKWCIRAFQSVYGYEFQGDNLLIARINLLTTFVEYMNDRWGHNPDDEELKKITNIIVWNLWQMDGITGTIPFGKPKEEYHQLSIFDFAVGINDTEPEEVNCKIFDWRSNESLTYNSMKKG